METNTLENIKMINDTGKGLSLGQVDTNTLENIKMINDTGKELSQRQMEQL